MSRRFAVLAVGCVVAFACLAVAYGAVTKIRWFDNVAEPNPDADGMAILNYAQGQDNIVVQVILTDLLANDGTEHTQYVVALREPGTWTAETNEEEVVEAVSLQAIAPGEFFFPIAAANLETDSKGHLTFQESTTPGSGDFSDSDVLIFLQSEWDAAFAGLPVPPDPPATELRIPVRMIGYNGTAAP